MWLELYRQPYETYKSKLIVHVVSNFLGARHSLKLNAIRRFGLIFVSDAFFEIYVLPEGLAKEPPQMLKGPQCLHLIDCTMVSPFHITKPRKKRKLEIQKQLTGGCSKSPVQYYTCVPVLWSTEHRIARNTEHWSFGAPKH